MVLMVGRVRALVPWRCRDQRSLVRPERFLADQIGPVAIRRAETQVADGVDPGDLIASDFDWQEGWKWQAPN